MELCEGGELADVLSQKKYFTEKDTKTIMSRVASAISYLHKNGKIPQLVSYDFLKIQNVIMK